MEYKVVFKDIFVGDLEQIVTYIAAHNPTAAKKLGERIIETAESLMFFPERFPKLRERPNIRRFVVANFKVFYRVLEQERTIEVLRCWDARRGTNPHM